MPSRQFRSQHFELRFDQAKLSRGFKLGKGKGTRSAQYAIIPCPGGKVPPGGEASWTIDVKLAGKFYLWLRYLPRGQAARRASAVNQKITAWISGRQVMSRVGGGRTDLSVEDKDVRPDLWTWARPHLVRYVSAQLPVGRHTLTLKNLTPGVRFDTLVVTDEPSFLPKDGRMKQAL